MHPIHQIEMKYADIMKTLYLTFFYAPLIPIGYPISFVGLMIYYWVEKVSFNYWQVILVPSYKEENSDEYTLGKAINYNDWDNGVPSDNFCDFKFDFQIPDFWLFFQKWHLLRWVSHIKCRCSNAGFSWEMFPNWWGGVIFDVYIFKGWINNLWLGKN